MAAATAVQYSARLFELSRHTQPVGVDIPVVKDVDFFTGPVRFVGIGGSSANRVAIRGYDTQPIERRSGGSVRLEVFAPDGSLVETTVLTMQYQPGYWHPGFAAIYDLAGALPQLQGIGRYDAVVTPLKPGMTFYALASVTDVDSQQVLLITASK